MADLIDREYLFEAVEQMEKIGTTDNENDSVVSTNAVLDIIDNAPTVNRWIPCSERLPEKQGRCLVTTESGQVEIRTFLFSLTQGSSPYFSGCEKVIAWMTAPDAYESPEAMCSKMTNGDRIRQMTNEELAVWFAPYMQCSMCDRGTERGCDRNDCIQSALAWMKKEEEAMTNGDKAREVLSKLPDYKISLIDFCNMFNECDECPINEMEKCTDTPMSRELWLKQEREDDGNA